MLTGFVSGPGGIFLGTAHRIDADFSSSDLLAGGVVVAFFVAFFIVAAFGAFAAFDWRAVGIDSALLLAPTTTATLLTTGFAVDGGHDNLRRLCLDVGEGQRWRFAEQGFGEGVVVMLGMSFDGRAFLTFGPVATLAPSGALGAFTAFVTATAFFDLGLDDVDFAVGESLGGEAIPFFDLGGVARVGFDDRCFIVQERGHRAN